MVVLLAKRCHTWGRVAIDTPSQKLASRPYNPDQGLKLSKFLPSATFPAMRDMMGHPFSLVRNTLAFCLFGALFPAPAQSAKTPNAKTPFNDAFISACFEGFRTRGEESSQLGRKICECTSKESKRQGVTKKALIEETAKIRRDSKYQIQNSHLMDAFRWCTIETMRALDHPGAER